MTVDREPSRGFFPSVFRITRALLVVYLIVVVLMMVFEHHFIFFPSTYDGSAAWSPRGLDYEDVYFEATDGTKLHAWYLPHKSSRAVVLFAHGNAGDITNRADMAHKLRQRGLSVFLFDYRGYGRSEGKPSEKGILDDARAARAKLAELAGVEQREIVLMGRSLGGGVVVDLAAKDGARALILESTFTSLPDVAAIHYPWLPVRWLMRSRLDSLSKISDYEGPLLQSHGNRDNLIPYEIGRRLFDAVDRPDGPTKVFFTVEGRGHNDPQPKEYYQQLDEFIDALP
jgi:hypothetical protein